MEEYYETILERYLKQINSEEYKKYNSESEQSKVDKKHALEVVEIVSNLWEKYEKTKIPIGLKIAALLHDSDRIYPLREVNTKDCPKNLYEYRKGIHSGNTALIFMEQNINNMPIELIRDIVFLILRHENGGDVNSKNILFEKIDEFTNLYNLNKAADYLYYSDKLSFFYSNIYEYKKRGNERLKMKVKFSIENLPDEIIKEIKNIEYKDNEIKNIIFEVLKNN